MGRVLILNLEDGGGVGACWLGGGGGGIMIKQKTILVSNFRYQFDRKDLVE